MFTPASAIPPANPLSDQRGECFLWAASFLLALCWLLMVLPYAPDLTGGGTLSFGDGACFYCAGKLVAEGRPFYGEGIFDCFTKTYFIHPPASVPLFDLWARLPLRVAMTIFYAAQAWALGTILTVLWRRFVVGKWPLMARYIFVICILFSDGVNSNILIGQVNLLVLAFALLATEWLIARRPVKSGASLLMAALLKPYFIPLGVMLLPRENRRGLYVAVAGGLGLCGLSILLYGPTLWGEFLAFHQKYLSASSGIFMHQPWAEKNNASLLATFERLGMSHANALILWQGLGGLVAVITLGAIYRLWQRRAEFEFGFATMALLLATIFPFLPIAWPVYLPWLLPALLWAAPNLIIQLLLLGFLLPPWSSLAETVSQNFLYPITLVSLLVLGLCWRKVWQPVRS